MNPVRYILNFGGGLHLVVIACSRCPTVATWWIGDVFLGRCQGGRS